MTAEVTNTAAATPDAAQAALGRSLGVRSIAFMALAGAAPLSAVVAAFPIVVSSSRNPASPLFFLLATMILVVFAAGFAKMGRFVVNAGAFYSYIQRGLGRIPGLSAATLAVGTYVMLTVALTAYLGAATSDTIDRYADVSTPWWLWAAVWLAVTAVLGYRDIELSAKVLVALLIIEALVVLVIDIAIMVGGGEDGISAAPIDLGLLDQGVPSLGLMFAFFSFIGFEVTAVFRNEARDPDRTIPRATYTAVIGVGAFYTFSAWAITLGVGTDRVVATATDAPTTMVLDLATRYVSPIMFDIVQVLLLTSFFACILTFHNVLTRYVFTLGSLKVLPARLGEVSERHRAPSVASVAVSIVVAALVAVTAIAGLDPVAEVYTWLSGAATLGVIVLMAVTSLAVLVFFWTNSHARQSVWSTSIAPALAFLALATVVWLVVSNFSALVPDQTVATALLVVLAVAAAIGAVLALRLRSRRSEIYRDLMPPTPDPSDR